MSRPVFLSFCYDDDIFRVNQIREMGIIEGQQVLNSNDFETIKRKGEESIKNWIDEQLMYKQCLIVLVGERTYNRKYVKYEILKAKEKGMPMFGIYIHNLHDIFGKGSKKGKNPFVELFGDKNIYKCIDPLHIENSSFKAYNTINKEINRWIEEAIDDNRKRKKQIILPFKNHT